MTAGLAPVQFHHLFSQALAGDANSAALLDALYPFLDMTGPGMPMPGANFIEHANLLGDSIDPAQIKKKKIEIGEPSVDDTRKILEGLRARYEEHHGVLYLDEALQAAAELSARYINDRHLPDKAIDVVDEAGANLRLRPIDQRPTEVDVPQV